MTRNDDELSSEIRRESAGTSHGDRGRESAGTSHGDRDRESAGTSHGETQGDPADELLWQLADMARGDLASDKRAEKMDDAAGPAFEAELRAYRTGTLDAAATRKIEQALARNATWRRQLSEIAEVTPEEPPSHLRQRAIDAMLRALSPPEEKLGPGQPASPRRPPRSNRPFRRFAPLLAAAVLVLAVGAGLVWRLGTGSELAPSPTPDAVAALASAEFDIRLELGTGIRSGRTSETRPSQSVVPPDQFLRIVVEPRDRAVAGVEFALYRQEDGQWRRLDAGDGLELERTRGSAAFRITAAALVGARSGSHDVLVAVAPEGQLPTTLAATSGEEAAAWLAERSWGKVVRRTLTLQENLD